MQSRGLLAKGACWFVNKGQQLNLWCDPWIPTLPNFRPRLKENVLLPRGIDHVSDLIDNTTGFWKVGVIRSYFEPQSAAAILALPLRPNNGDDVLKWTPYPKGLFSVKSAVRCVQSRHEVCQFYLTFVGRMLCFMSKSITERLNGTSAFVECQNGGGNCPSGSFASRVWLDAE